MNASKKTVVCDQQGNVLRVIDDREVEIVRAYRLSRVRKRAGAAIESAVPEYKQRNIALGLITGAEKTQLLAKLNEVRDYCNGLEDQINGVSWNGKAKSKHEACDEIESVSWAFVSEL